MTTFPSPRRRVGSLLVPEQRKPDPPAEIIAVLYSRVSRDRSKRRKSVTEQDAEGRAAARRHGATVPDDAVFVDNARSASRFARKPRIGWEAVLAYLATQPVHMLILWEVSRADRRLGPWVNLLDLCRDRNIKIHIVKDDETYDPADPRDRRYLAQEGIDAEEEANRTSKRILRDKRAAALDGRPPGRVNWGYQRIYDGSGYYVETVIDEARARIKRDLVDAKILAGVGLRSIALDLNDRRRQARGEAWRNARQIAATPGDWETRWRSVRAAVREGRLYDAPEGGEWRAMQVRRLALNPAYAALRVHQGEIVGPAAWPAITDVNIYERLHARLTDPARRTHTGTTLTAQLTGAAICGRCEGPIRCGGTNRAGHPIYRCGACRSLSIERDPADQIINAFMRARLRDQAAMAVWVAPLDNAATAAIEEEIKTLRQRLDEHYVEATEGRLSARGLSIIEARLLPQIERAQATARRLGTPTPLTGHDPEQLADTWPDQPVARRRDIIAALAEVRVSPAGRGVRTTPWRFAESRWRGSNATWGDLLREAGESPASARLLVAL